MPRIRDLAMLVFVALIGFWIRIYAGRASIVDGSLILDGYDEFYHMRRIFYTVHNFPNTLWFDSYLDYPRGMHLTWPPLFDQITAGFAIMMGAQDKAGIEFAAALVPPLLGLITVVVIYLFMRDIFNERVALLSAIAVAIAPYHVAKTKFGVTDHHCLEILLLLLIFLFLARSYTYPKRWYIYSLLTGLAMVCLAYTWIGSAAYFGMLLPFALLQTTMDLKDRSITKAAPLLLAFITAILILLTNYQAIWLRESLISLNFLLIFISVMYICERMIIRMKLPWIALPAILIVGAILILTILPVFIPQFADAKSLIFYGFNYIFGGEMIGKISEAEPLYVGIDFLSVFGINMALSLLGIIVMILYINKSKCRDAYLLLVALTLASLIITVGQKRFLYIYSIEIGCMISLLIFAFMDRFFDTAYLSSKNDFDNIEKNDHHKFTNIVFISLAIILLIPSTMEYMVIANDPLAISSDWYESLLWLNDYSPKTSYFDHPDATPEYGVLSWWDFGNWILYLAERPVVANNLQAGIFDSARFFVSSNETEAYSILDERNVRYVITDMDLVYGKFPALASWLSIDSSKYQLWQMDDGQYSVQLLQPMGDTMIGRLHMMDGVGLDRFRLVYESTGSYSSYSIIKIFEYVKGVTFTGTASGSGPIYFAINLTTNRGRNYSYIDEVDPINGIYSIKIPYSTEKKCSIVANGPCMIVHDGTVYQIDISEEDVIDGGVIKFDL